jgi:multimeric flavodoxin WrbA
MNILVIMGSPRKKDGAKILKSIDEKFQTHEKTIFEYVYLKNENIEDCRGCDRCFKDGEEFCPVRDDLKIICGKMENADGIVFACPVYAHQVTAPMKKFIDRLAYNFHRPKFFGKFALIVVTTASSGLKDVIDYLTLIVKGWGFNLVDRIGIVSTQYFEDNKSFNPKYHDHINKQIEKAILKIIGMKTGEINKSPDIFSLVLFQAMRQKAKHIKHDTEYWQKNGWFDAKYYYDIKLNFFKWLSYLAIQHIVIPVIFRKK